MRVGTLEIQIMASLAKLSKDMNDAQRVVGGAMGNVERSVASAKRAMQALGVGLPLAMITDQVRRMTDQYTKLDAQLRLATKSQAQYAQGMADIRRISSIAQADLSSTSMLYTRLMNVMDGSGVSQAKLATVTETVAFGLKAYGASAQEASSAALQLSQAMGANRLGGEEFRAVMEAMPNVMKVLAKSMRVPLGELRALSIAGKITADEMVKAFGNPAIAAEFKRLAENAQTITGAWVVARNELTLLIGEFMKSSGATRGTISAFNGVGTAIRFLSDNLNVLLNVLYAYVTVLGGKLIVGLVQAKAAQMVLNAAHAEAIAVNLAMARSEAANALVARDVTAARAWQTGVTTGLTAANKRLTAATAEVSAAEKLAAASSVGIAGRIKGAVGKTGWIGLAIFGIWSVVDFLDGMQRVADGAKKTAGDMAGLSLQQVMLMRQEQTAELYRMRHAFMGEDRYRVEIRYGEERLKILNAQVEKLKTIVKVGQDDLKLSHNQIVMQERIIELSKQFSEHKLTEAEYLKRVNIELAGGSEIVKEIARADKLAEKELSARMKAAAKLYEEEVKMRQDYADTLSSETRSINEKTAAALLETESIGKTKAEIDLLQAARYDHETQVMRETLATYESAVACTIEAEALKEAIAAREAYKKAQTDQSARRKVQESIDAEAKAHEKMWKSIDKTAHDTFVSILDGGKDAATRLKEAFKNSFFDWLYQMTLKKWIINVSGAMAGTGASGMAMAGAGGGGAGLLDIASAGLGMAMNGLTASQALTAASAYGSAALSATTLAEGMSMATSGLSLAMPYIGAAIAAVSVISGLFGSKGTPTANTGNAAMQFDANGRQIGRQTFYGGSSASTDAVINGMQAAYAQSAATLGIGTIASQFNYGGNTGKNGQSPNFALGGGAGGVNFYQPETPLTNAAVELAAQRAVFAALQGSQMPTYLRKVFGGLNAGSMSAEQINSTLAFAQALKQTRDAMIETRTPTEVFNQNVADAMLALNTSAATFKVDFVKAIDAGLTEVDFAKWNQLGAAIAQLSSAWQSLTDAIFAEVARIRGVLGTPSGTSAQFATMTAMARAGDENAAKLLPGVAKAMLDVAAMTAGNATDLARIQGRTAASLEVTGMSLAGKYGLSIPAYANGGTHTGGIRLVGENGPELEYTGSSRISSNSDTRKMLDNSGVIDSVNALRAELRAVVSNAQKQTKILDRWDGQGMPEVRTV